MIIILSMLEKENWDHGLSPWSKPRLSGSKPRPHLCGLERYSRPRPCDQDSISDVKLLLLFTPFPHAGLSQTWAGRMCFLCSVGQAECGHLIDPLIDLNPWVILEPIKQATANTGIVLLQYQNYSTYTLEQQHNRQPAAISKTIRQTTRASTWQQSHWEDCLEFEKEQEVIFRRLVQLCIRFCYVPLLGAIWSGFSTNKCQTKLILFH